MPSIPDKVEIDLVNKMVRVNGEEFPFVIAHDAPTYRHLGDELYEVTFSIFTKSLDVITDA